MARRKRKRRRAKKKFPVGVGVGFLATILGGKTQGQMTIQHLMRGDLVGAFRRITTNVVGWNDIEGFNMANMNLEPLLIGLLVSAGLGRLVNPRIRDIPYVKL